MDSFRKLILILTVLLILPAGLYAQAGNSDPEAPPEGPAEASAEVPPEGAADPPPESAEGPPPEGTAGPPPEAGEASPRAAEAGGFAVAVDLRLGGMAMTFIPGLSAVVGVPMQLSSDSFSLIPMVGFLYIFDIWSDVHSTFYVPVGIEAVYNPYNLKLKVLYCPPVGTEAGIHLLSVTGGAELELVEAGAFSMNFDIGLGPTFVFDPAGTGILFSINSSLIMRYKI